MNQCYVNDDLPTYSQTVAKNNQYASNDEEKDETNYEYAVPDEMVDEEIQQEIDLYTRLVKHIQDTYPIRYVKIDSIVNFLLNFVIIVFQIIATNQNAALSSYGTAVWGGIYNILIASLALLTSKILF